MDKKAEIPMEIIKKKTRISVKTSKLEDQYTNLFNLAVWPEKPPEIHVFEKGWIFGKLLFHFLKHEVWLEVGLESTILDETR